MVILFAGKPQRNRFVDPMMSWPGPKSLPHSAPAPTPVTVTGRMVIRLCAGMHIRKMFGAVGIAVMLIDTFGKGIGMPRAGGMSTSGNANPIPGIGPLEIRQRQFSLAQVRA